MKVFENISLFFDKIARIACFIMMAMIVVGVIGRAINVNIFGVVEMVEMSMVIIVFLSLSYTHISGSHIAVNIVVNKFSKRTQAIIDCTVFFLSLLYVVVLVWQGGIAFIDSIKFKEGISVLNIPVAPFRFFVPFGCLLMAVSLIISIVQSAKIASVRS